MVNNALLGGTIAWVENNNKNMTINTTSGWVQVPETGSYNITYTANIVPSTNGSVFIFTFGKDSGAGFVAQDSFVLCEVRTSGITDTFVVVFSCLPPLAANDKVSIMVKETSAGEEFTLVASNFVIARVA